MEHRQGHFTGVDGIKLFWQAWVPGDEVKANIIIIHGFGEHSGRYQNLVDTLVPQGYGVWSWDHKGHGRSQGQRGHVDSFTEYIQDAHTFYSELVKHRTGEEPLFVLGHSMGSIIAMNYVARHWHGLTGCVLSGTGSASGVGNKALSLITAILSKLVPRKSITFPLPPEFISRDPKIVEAYKEDALVHDQVSFRLAAEMTKALRSGVESFQKTDIPVLIQYGSLDESFTGQQQLYQGLEVKDKTLRVYQGLKHEVYNELEPDRTRVLDDLLQWLNWHL